ncbi:hypothetical protein D030_2791A, partial [Vibrio parahaemolyticus AQ3810]
MCSDDALVTSFTS